MKSKLIAVLVMVSAWAFVVPGAHAQAGDKNSPPAASDQDIQLLRQDLRSNRKQLVAANLTLTDQEATKFWPVYDQYTTELTKIGDQKYEVIKEYAQGFGSLTDAQALSLMNRALALDEDVAQLRIKYVPIFNKVLPGTKTATFFQIDRRINDLINVQLASEIPLAQGQH